MLAPDTVLAALDAAGIRITAPRRALVGLIASRDGHFTAEDLLAGSTAQGLGLGRATIFRGLDTLAAIGVVERLDLPTGGHAFVACEPAREHHHHVVCRRCGRAEPVEDCGMTAVAAEVERTTGYRVDTHRIELYGACPACRDRIS